MRTEEARQQQLRDIDAYKELVDLVNTKVSAVHRWFWRLDF